MDLKKLFAGIVGWALLSSPSLAFCETRANQALPYKIYKTSGDNYLRQNKPELAISQYRKALRFGSTSPAIYFDLAIAYYLQKNFKETTLALEKVVQLDPKDAEAFYDLGCLKLCQRQLHEARISFEKARLLCSADSRFLPLANHGLDFLKAVNELDPAKQELFFELLLQIGLPSLSGA